MVNIVGRVLKQGLCMLFSNDKVHRNGSFRRTKEQGRILFVKSSAHPKNVVGKKIGVEVLSSYHNDSSQLRRNRIVEHHS